jgi:hypothetical protein
MKKLFVTLVALLTISTAFAEQALPEEELLQTETQQAMGAFFQDFSTRLTEKKTTDADKELIQIIDNNVATPLKHLGSFLVKLQAEEIISDEELEATLGPIETSLQAGLDTLTESVIQVLDFNKINEEGPAQLKRSVSLLIGMGLLDVDATVDYIPLSADNINREIVSLSAFMTSLGYLAETGTLTEEEVILITSVLLSEATGEGTF